MGLSDWWLSRKVRSPNTLRRYAALNAIGKKKADGSRIHDRFLQPVLDELGGSGLTAERAAEVLKANPDPRAVGALAAAFANAEDSVSRTALEALRRIPDAPGAMVAAFPAASSRRVQALEFLANALAPEGVAVLDRCFEDKDGLVRAAAANLAAQVGARDRTTVLEKLLCDERRDVRRAAAKSLAALQWKAPSPELVAWAAVAMGEVRRASDMAAAAIPALADALHDDKLREAALAGLAPLGDAAATAVARELRNQFRRYASAEALGAIGGPIATRKLTELLPQVLQESAMAGKVINALVRIGDDSAVNALEQALEKPGRSLGELVNGLAACGDKGMAALARHLVDLFSLVKPALVKVGRQAQAPLLSALDATEGRQRRAAAETLQAMSWTPRNDDERRLLAAGLGQYDALARDGRRALPLLKRELDTGDVKPDLIHALSTISGEDVTDLLSGALSSKRDEVLTAALKALGARNDPRCLPALAAALLGQGGSYYSTKTALIAAIKPFGAAAIPALETALDSASPDAFARGVEALESLGWAPKNARARARALVARARWNDVTRDAADEAETYFDLLADSSSSEGLEKALAEVPAQQIKRDVLFRQARSAKMRARRIAIQLLSNLSGDDVDQALCDAVADQSHDIRLMALQALEKRASGAGPRVAETLWRALRTDDRILRCWAAQGLMRGGQSLAAELPGIVKGLFERASGQLPKELQDGPFAQAIGLNASLHQLVMEAFDYDTKEIGDKYSHAIPALDAGDGAVSSLCVRAGLFADCALEAIAVMPDRTVSLPCCIYSQDWTLDFSQRRRQASREVERRRRTAPLPRV